MKKTYLFPNTKPVIAPIVEGRTLTWYPLTAKSAHVFGVAVTTASRKSKVSPFAAYTFQKIGTTGTLTCISPSRNITVSSTSTLLHLPIPNNALLLQFHLIWFQTFLFMCFHHIYSAIPRTTLGTPRLPLKENKTRRSRGNSIKDKQTITSIPSSNVWI